MLATPGQPHKTLGKWLTRSRAGCSG
jgi:hypothetical protein